MTKTTSWYGVKCSSPNPNSKALTAPVIEGGSIFMQLSTEAFLKSFDGVLRIFSGVPTDFSGSFSDLRARGGFFVSARAENGKTAYAEITSPKSSVLILKAESGISYSKEGREEIRNGEQVIVFDMLAGETLTLTAR